MRYPHRLQPAFRKGGSPRSVVCFEGSKEQCGAPCARCSVGWRARMKIEKAIKYAEQYARGFVQGYRPEDPESRKVIRHLVRDALRDLSAAVVEEIDGGASVEDIRKML